MNSNDLNSHTVAKPLTPKRKTDAIAAFKREMITSLSIMGVQE
jgi:hypothetical protein